MSEEVQPNGFNRIVSLFLAEELRSRRVSLARAAEISRRVLQNLGNIHSETDALNMLSDIEKDFEEVGVIKQALHFGHAQPDVKQYEQQIKEYASDLLKQDIESSATFLRDCSGPQADIQVLCVKYPKFCEYLSRNSDAVEALGLNKTPQLVGVR